MGCGETQELNPRRFKSEAKERVAAIGRACTLKQFQCLHAPCKVSCCGRLTAIYALITTILGVYRSHHPVSTRSHSKQQQHEWVEWCPEWDSEPRSWWFSQSNDPIKLRAIVTNMEARNLRL